MPPTVVTNTRWLLAGAIAMPVIRPLMLVGPIELHAQPFGSRPLGAPGPPDPPGPPGPLVHLRLSRSRVQKPADTCAIFCAIRILWSCSYARSRVRGSGSGSGNPRCARWSLRKRPTRSLSSLSGSSGYFVRELSVLRSTSALPLPPPTPDDGGRGQLASTTQIASTIANLPDMTPSLATVLACEPRLRARRERGCHRSRVHGR